MLKIFALNLYFIVFLFVHSITLAQGEALVNEEVLSFISEFSLKHGMSEDNLTDVFSKVDLIPSSVALMDKPAEILLNKKYFELMLTKERVFEGRQYYNKYSKVLRGAEKKYGVPKHVIVSIIGVETHYGKAPLRYRAIDTLYTLSFAYPRRAKYFKGELESFLLFAYLTGSDPFSYKSSYAGAMGIPQFMPSNVSKYAVDGDNDKIIDILNSHDDAIYSVANYLNKSGWRAKEPVTLKVRFKGKKYKKYLSNKVCIENRATVKTLKKAGVIFPINVPNNYVATLFEVSATENLKEYYVAFNNFCSIMKYNPSIRYVLGVSLLSNRILRSAFMNKKRR